MLTRRRSIRLLVSLLVLGGCAAGRDFVRPQPASLMLGKTSYKEIFQKFGTPYQEGTATKNNRPVRSVAYSYASGAGTPLVDGVTPGRTISFHFVDDALVGYEFVSSFRNDHTDFDEAKVHEIKKGETNRTRVVELLGPPHGLLAWPLVKDPAGKALVYLYVQVKPVAKIHQKRLIVTLDTSDIVSDVELVTSGAR